MVTTSAPEQDAPTPGHQPLRTTALVFLFMTVFIDTVGYGIIVPLLPLFAKKFAFGDGVWVAFIAGGLGALYALMQFLTVPMWGSLSDRYGRRPVLLISLAGTGLSYVILALAPSIWWLFLAVALDGSTGANMTIAQAYMADSTPRHQRTRGMGMIGAAFGLGLMGGPALGGLLSIYGLSVPALTAAGLAAANVVFGALLLPESLPGARRTQRLTVSFNPLDHLRALWDMNHLRPLLLTIFLLNLGFAGLHTTFPLFSAARFGWGPYDNGWFFAFIGVCAVVTQAGLVGLVQPRLGERWMLLVGLALMSSMLVLVAFAPLSWLLYPLIGLLALGVGLAIPAGTSLVSQQTTEQQQGRVIGGMNALLSLTMMLGPLMTGTAFDLVAVWAPYVLSGLLAGAALLVVVGHRSRIRRPALHTQQSEG